MIDILISDVTNATLVNGEIVGTGIFDKLMQTTILHIEDQLEKNHITQNESGPIYASMVQNAMQQAVQFVLQEKVVEVDIVIREAELAIKAAQLEIAYKDLEIRLAQLEEIQTNIKILEQKIVGRKQSAIISE